ncbi:MAG TPA: hypothetical protein DEP69_01875, partial [Acidimicrobiaceae bacterium]|nr:hypothetical protein [Acidimicrobiaceae bacterium]
DLFAGIPILGDILRMQARPDSAALAGSSAQLAHLIATGGKPEPNIDPLDRVALSELARVAELHVAKVTGLDPTSSGAPAAVEPVTRSQWAATAVTACRPLTDRIAERLRADEPDDESNDPAAVMNFLMRTLNPTLVSVCGGAMAGQLSQTAFGDCDLPVARTADAIGVVTANVADFAQQWSLEPDDVRLWVCIRELALHSVFAVDHVRAAVDELIEAYVDGFRLDPAAAQRQLAEQLESTVSSIDGPLDPSAIQQQAKLVFGNPEVLLGTSRTAGQEALAERLESRLGLIAAYVDHVLAAAGSGLIAGYDSLTEALRRRRTADTPGERYANRLLGVGVG